MQSRLRELEPLPELLRSSELRHQQMTEELSQFKQFHDRDMRLIDDLTAKVIIVLIVYYRLISHLCVVRIFKTLRLRDRWPKR